MRSDLTGYADFQVRLRLQWFRLFTTVRYRQVRLITFDVPGLPPYKVFSNGTVTQDEYSVLVGGDYRFASPGLTAGLTLRTLRPATMKSPTFPLGGNNPPAFLTESRVLVLHGPNEFNVLPTGQAVLPEFHLTASLLFNRFHILHVLMLIDYAYDPNRTSFRENTQGQFEPVRIGSHGGRFELLLQLKL